MPFDGNGNYKFPINSWNPAVNGNQATAQDWQQTINDLATAMSSVVVADGQKMMSGNLRMGNNKVTGLGAPSDDTDAIRRAQFKKGAPITSAATIAAPTEGSFFDVNGSVNLEGLSGGYDGQSFALVFSSEITIKNSERLKTSSGLDIKVVVGHAYNFVRLADDRWFVFDTTRTAESITFKPEGNIAATNVQAAIKELDDEKQPVLGYTPMNRAGDIIGGNMYLPENGSGGTWALTFANNSGAPVNVFWQVVPDQDYYLMFKDRHANPLLAIGVNGPTLFHRRPLFAGNTPWDSGNFNPGNKVNAGTEVKFLTGTLEFGSIIVNSGLNTADLPDPYVVTGLSGYQGGTGNLVVVLRGRKLYV